MGRTPESTYRIPSPTDGEIMGLFKGLSGEGLENVKPDPITIGLAGLALSDVHSLAGFVAYIESSSWELNRQITTLRVAFSPRVTVQFARSVSEANAQSGPVVHPSDLEAEIWFDINQIDATTPKDVRNALSHIEHFRAQGPAARHGTLDEVVNIQRRQLADLTGLHTKIVLDADQARLKREADFEERQRKLDADNRAWRAAEEEVLEAERGKLTARVAQLDEREKAVDDRAYTHARRQMRESITQDLKDRLSKPGVPTTTIQQRATITRVCLGLMAAFGTLLGASAYEFFNQTLRGIGPADHTLLFLVAGRTVLAGAAVAGVAFYLLGWLRQTHDDDLRTDRELERYRYDLDRASWAIETILEADARIANPEASAVPDDWIIGVTHGLFARSEKRPDDQAGLESLGALLNVAAEAEFGPGGPKLKITKRGISKLKRFGLATEEE